MFAGDHGRALLFYLHFFARNFVVLFFSRRRLLFYLDCPGVALLARGYRTTYDVLSPV